MITGKMLKQMGINMNFAPVLDVNTNKDNPIIGERAFSNNTEEVIETEISEEENSEAEELVEAEVVEETAVLEEESENTESNLDVEVENQNEESEVVDSGDAE